MEFDALETGPRGRAETVEKVLLVEEESEVGGKVEHGEVEASA
jgi:hypothetical protein